MLTEAKGLLVLVDACGLLSAQGVPFRLELIGQFQSPAFETVVRRRLAALGIESQVNFAGPVHGDAKWQAFAGADVLCLPTFYEAETFGVVLVEAMSFRLPVVATKWRGIPEIVDDGATGFLVEPHDPAAVAERLAQLHDDPSLRRWLGSAGRRKFLREFTTEHFTRRMEAAMIETAG
jgi:glycosyltransferase involved in cell wall biosynthesis